MGFPHGNLGNQCIFILLLALYNSSVEVRFTSEQLFCNKLVIIIVTLK